MALCPASEADLLLKHGSCAAPQCGGSCGVWGLKGEKGLGVQYGVRGGSSGKGVQAVRCKLSGLQRSPAGSTAGATTAQQHPWQAMLGTSWRMGASARALYLRPLVLGGNGEGFEPKARCSTAQGAGGELGTPRRQVRGAARCSCPTVWPAAMSS